MHSNLALVVVLLTTHSAALLVTVMLHESGHFLVSRVLGGQPELFHIYVRHKQLLPQSRALVAAGGPVVSLLQGSACLGILQLVPLGLLYLMLLWMALLGLANFFGYLITTAFWRDGDIGKIAGLLNWGWPAKIGLTCIGLLAMPILTTLAGRGFSQLAQVISPWGTVGFYVWAILLPWLAGSLYFALLSRPAPLKNVLSYPLFSGLYLLPVVLLLPALPVQVPAVPMSWFFASLSAAVMTSLLFIGLKDTNSHAP